MTLSSAKLLILGAICLTLGVGCSSPDENKKKSVPVTSGSGAGGAGSGAGAGAGAAGHGDQPEELTEAEEENDVYLNGLLKQWAILANGNPAFTPDMVGDHKTLNACGIIHRSGQSQLKVGSSNDDYYFNFETPLTVGQAEALQPLMRSLDKPDPDLNIEIDISGGTFSYQDEDNRHGYTEPIEDCHLKVRSVMLKKVWSEEYTFFNPGYEYTVTCRDFTISDTEMKEFNSQFYCHHSETTY